MAISALLIKEFPILGEQSLLASRFAIAVLQIAGDEAYKKAHDELISLRGDVTPETLGRLATESGAGCRRHSGQDGQPRGEQRDRGQPRTWHRGCRSTAPRSFVIDETMVRGYVPLDGMRQIVDGQRKG